MSEPVGFDLVAARRADTERAVGEFAQGDIDLLEAGLEGLDDTHGLRSLGGRCSRVRERVTEIDLTGEISGFVGTEFAQLMEHRRALGIEGGCDLLAVDVWHVVLLDPDPEDLCRKDSGRIARLRSPPARVAGEHDLPEVLRADACVHLRCRKARMTEDLLDGPQVCSTFDQMGGGGVPQDVRRET